MLPGSPEVSVTLLVRDKPTLMASTGPLAVDLDERQYERGHGPCLDAARTGQMIEVTDTRTDPRWRQYLARAAERGCLSSLSVPLHIDEEDSVTGALNIYARDADAFDEDSRAVADRFGPYASIAAGNVHAFQSARDQAENLRRALESRAVIDQAKGVLIERYRLTPDQAFQLLAHASMSANRKVRDIADHLVRTGELRAATAAAPDLAAASARPKARGPPDSRPGLPGDSGGQAPPVPTTSRRGRSGPGTPAHSAAPTGPGTRTVSAVRAACRTPPVIPGLRRKRRHPRHPV